MSLRAARVAAASVLGLALLAGSGCSQGPGPAEPLVGGAGATAVGGAGAPAGGSAGSVAGAGAGGLAGAGAGSGGAIAGSGTGGGGTDASGGTAGGGVTSMGGAAGASGSAGNGGAPEAHWVGTWATGCQITEPANLPPTPGLANNTLRQIVRVSIGGKKLRLRISNEFGTAPVTLAGVHLAKATTGSGVDVATDSALTFSGNPSVTIAEKSVATSDPFDFDLAPLSKAAITIAFGAQTGDVTGHPGSRTTSYLQSGAHLSAATLSGATTDHWYFISGIDVMAPPTSGAIAILGDSITDGRGSTTNGNDRWPDRLAERLQGDPTKSHIAVLNLGIGGNTVTATTGGLGPTALSRFQSQILAQPGVRWVVVLEGVNDIGNGVAASVLTAGLQTIVQQARAANLPIYGVPILPFAGNTAYDSPANQQARTDVNDWIRKAGSFDGTLALEEAVSNGATPPKLKPAFDSGDALHLNPAGYQALADAVDLSRF
jgi:lysophospholipase L1-like esterase